MSQTLSLNSYLEHTALKPDLTVAEVQQLCNDAMKYHFAGVCVPPYFIDDVVEILNGTGIDIVTVVGFPMGYSSIISKFEETEEALHKGADHIDMVINIAAVKNGDWDTVENELETITRLVHADRKIVKVIAETGLMSEVELELICRIANEAGIDYLKTSTGMNGTGATLEAVQNMRSLLKPTIKIKASGGIKTKAFALQLIEAGASRIGASKSVEMMQE